MSNIIPRFRLNKTSILLSDTTDTVIDSVSLKGSFFSIMILCDRKSFELVIEVDSTEVLRVSGEDLNDSNIYALDDELEVHTSSFPIKTYRGGKQIVVSFAEGVRIGSNITIKAKSTTSATTNIVSSIIEYGEKA